MGRGIGALSGIFGKVGNGVKPLGARGGVGNAVWMSDCIIL